MVRTAVAASLQISMMLGGPSVGAGWIGKADRATRIAVNNKSMTCTPLTLASTTSRFREVDSPPGTFHH